MATLEDENRDLKEKNNELVQKVQYWKMAAAAKEDEKLELMKEINELRLKLSHIRSGGAAEARKLDAALQSASQEALSHLVQASTAVARSIELTKAYMHDRQEIENLMPRWSTISVTPSNERVHRVPPLLMGGQSIQPVVSLSRTVLNTSLLSRSPNRNRNVTERAVPLHMLQDVYIPLTRIDADLPGSNMDTENDVNVAEDSIQDLALDDSMERSLEGAQDMSEENNFEVSRRLEAVTEDLEPETDVLTPPSRSRVDNPLEGPSWLLDSPSFAKSKQRASKSRTNLEPDSTTEFDDGARSDSPACSQRIDQQQQAALCASTMAAACFSPTVRRRKRTASPRGPAPPPPSPSPSPPPGPGSSPLPAVPRARSRRHTNSGRVLKVLVAKMRLDGDSEEEPTPAKRATNEGPVTPATPVGAPVTLAHAPSPNGATDAALLVLEHKVKRERGSGDRRHVSRKPSGGHASHLPTSDEQEHPLGDDDGMAGLMEDHKTDKSGLKNTMDDENWYDSIGIGSRVSAELGHSRTGSTDLGHSRTGSTDPGHSRTGSTDPGHSRTGTDPGRRAISGDRGQSRAGSVDLGQTRTTSGGHDSDSGSDHHTEGRTRRPRKAVTYKEKPLNRKMRR
ncbi:uncharacterized protein LOC131852354 [Achroia grisella]|uniref:uncharacterized protein LOC131852354 n=1 Tax=Achroia grisella TaxID=688607 RepID=UPI0027D232EF|nr:uncharacterized protein LOC131852354 [Achroia grisella]